MLSDKLLSGVTFTSVRDVLNYYYQIVESDFVNLGISYCLNIYPTGIYFFKINNGNTRIMSEFCSKLTIKIPHLHK